MVQRKLRKVKSPTKLRRSFRVFFRKGEKKKKETRVANTFLIIMFFSPLEQFQILPFFSFGIALFDFSITNAMVTTFLG